MVVDLYVDLSKCVRVLCWLFENNATNRDLCGVEFRALLVFPFLSFLHSTR
jgi:hypothetical protein